MKAKRVDVGEYTYKGRTIYRRDSIPHGYYGRWRIGLSSKGDCFGTLQDACFCIDQQDTKKEAAKEAEQPATAEQTSNFAVLFNSGDEEYPSYSVGDYPTLKDAYIACEKDVAKRKARGEKYYTDLSAYAIQEWTLDGEFVDSVRAYELNEQSL